MNGGSAEAAVEKRWWRVVGMMVDGGGGDRCIGRILERFGVFVFLIAVRMNEHGCFCAVSNLLNNDRL